MLQAPSFLQQYGNSLPGYPSNPQQTAYSPYATAAAAAAGGGNHQQHHQQASSHGTTPPASNVNQAFLESRGDGVRSGNNVPPQMAAAGQPYAYTSAPYTQSVPAQAPSALAPHHPFVQQQHDLRQSASPQPNAAAQNTRLSPPNKYPMAAPPLPQTPTSQQAAAANNVAPSPGTPQSPGSQNREQQRINLLFEINVELLQEVSRLQGEGQGGAISPQQLEQLKKMGKGDRMASEEYIQCLRRVQANLAYLMPKAQNDANSLAKAPLGPAHMTPPPHMTQLQSKYEQLRELFPGWSGMDHRPSEPSYSPNPNGMANSPAAAQA